MFKNNGLPKGQAMVSSCVIAVVGFFIIRWTPVAEDWIRPNMFILVWIIFYNMLHNNTLDKPEDLYEYKSGNREFLDKDEMNDWLSVQGGEGWSLVFMYPDLTAHMSYSYMFKRKYFSKPKVTTIRP